MISIHRKAMAKGLLALAIGWMLAIAGFTLAGRSKLTVGTLRRYVASVDFGSLSADGRRQTIDKLVEKFNALPAEERRQARLERPWTPWFAAMSEAEKNHFVEATMPADLHQVLTAFDFLPEEIRRRVIDDSLRRLREARTQLHNDGSLSSADNGASEISDELREKFIRDGLEAHYAESSAQAKADLALLLEELHRMMESGASLRGRPRR